MQTSIFDQLAASGLMTAIVVFIIVWAILWLFLPFAIFGVKPLLREIANNQREILATMRGQQPPVQAPGFFDRKSSVSPPEQTNDSRRPLGS